MMIQQLQHHGIKGMKWGRRRYQNRDGSLTQAGRHRYQSQGDKSNEGAQPATKPKSPKSKTIGSMSDGELGAKVKRMNLEKQYVKLAKERAKPSTLSLVKSTVDSTNQLVDVAKDLNRKTMSTARKREKLDLSSMSDKDLRERINRANLERQYNDLFAEETAISKGRQRVTRALEIGGGVLATGSSALAIALAVKELAK